MNETPVTNLPFSVESLQSLDSNRLAELGRESDSTIVTLAAPMQTLGRETRENRIRFKNVLSTALEQLDGENEALREQLESLQTLDDEEHPFWQHQTEGLMMKVTGDQVTAFQLPYEVPEIARISNRFYSFPMIELMHQQRGYLLALDLNELKLYRLGGNGDRLTEIEFHEKVPTSLAEAMKYDDPEKSLQFHSTASGGGDAVYHGHGRAGDEANDKKKIQRFFEMVDKRLADSLPDREAPLFLAGPPHEVGIYRGVNSYQHLEDDFIEINTAVDRAEDDSLEQRVAEWFSKRPRVALERAKEKVKAAVATDHGANRMEDLLNYATEGRIDTLIVRDHASFRGVYDSKNRTVTADEKGDDLVDLITYRAATTGASVFILPEDNELMDEDSPAAAALRY